MIRAGRAPTIHAVAALCDGGAGLAGRNLDTTVIAQAPKLTAMPEMRANIAADLRCDIAQVSVKATTTERLGSPVAARIVLGGLARRAKEPNPLFQAA
jgi:2-C-methyl-D-erythritol 2,4-cyclodiphosphate synthase